MKRFITLLGLAVLVTAFVALMAGPAMAEPDWGTDTDDCLSCHGDGSNGFEAAHDGQVGECLMCHSAPGQTIHGQWTDTPAACARCHRTHSAAADGLLVMEANAFCELCHGRTAGFAQTNVLDGLLRYNSGSLRGGGFENAMMNTATNDPDTDPDLDQWQFPVSLGAEAPVTSTHSLGVEALIWGSGDINPLPSAGETSTALECTTCHDPHAFHKTYRMLRKQPKASSVAYRGSTEYVFVTDQLAYAKWNPGTGILAYDTDDYTEVDYTSPDVYDADGNLVEVTFDSHGPVTVTKHSQQLANWCASCHERYHAEKEVSEGVGSTDSGDAIFAFRHKTGDAMISGTESSSCGYNGLACHGAPDWFDTNKQLSCLGCHVAHGTSAEMHDFAQSPWPGEPVSEGELPGTAVDPDLPGAWDNDWNSRSSLLRLDNRGVCQNFYCHPMGTPAWLGDHEQGLDH